MPAKLQKKNLNFQIGLLQAKVGQQPKIARCALIAKADKAKPKVPADAKEAEAELQRLAQLKQQGVEHHERRVLRKAAKEGVRPEVQKLTKRLRSQQMSLEKLRAADSVPEKILTEKEATVRKLEAQLGQLKHLDLDAVVSFAWDALSQNKTVDEVGAARAKEDPSKEAQQLLTVLLRVIKSKPVATQLEALRKKRGNAGDDNGGHGEGAGSSKERDILAKLKKGPHAKGGSVSGEDEDSGSGGDWAEEDGDEDGSDADGNDSDGMVGGDDDLFVGSLKAAMAQARAERGTAGSDSGDSASDDSEGESEDDVSDAAPAGDGDIFLGSLNSASKMSQAQKGAKKRGGQKAKPQRKNRMGQQARRKLAEQKFGKSAKHLRQEGGESRQANAKFDGKGGNPRAKGKFGKGGVDDAASYKPAGHGQSHGKTTNQKEEKLHPSWEASQKRKQQASAVQAFAGKKIKLSDD